ncbi:peptidylprolyl isomerase [Crocinitomicaceae bacterium]|jgi:peptidyl-prolyl cis-trans isomerase SurA|nr:peptidylprolyl isomerase [Crocinitomicaceae bacterium]
MIKHTLLPLVLLFTSTCFAQNNKLVNKVLAQVGDNIILLSDIEIQKLQAKQSEMEVDFDFSCSVLEQLMVQELLVNQAKLDSIPVSDEQVDAEMENRLRIIEKDMGGRDKLEEYYGKTTTQIKEEFRSVIKDRILAQEMERSITNGISVTPKEVSSFFEALPKDSVPFINMKLSFQQIVIYPDINAEDNKRAFNELNEVLDLIVVGGKSFETMARIHSDDPGSASLGGKIEASRGMMVPQFESTVFKLKVGEVSDIIETQYGYHIIKLISRKGDDYTCLHILNMPEFSNDAINNASVKMDECYKRLNENEITWNEAISIYSNDDRTKQNSGIITNPITGDQLWDMEDLNQVDQQIYLLTDAMEKGDITSPNLYVDIYERKQGIRIVRLMERFTPHIANINDDYSLIKAAAENDKKERIMGTWIDSKISNAFIRVDESYSKCDFSHKWFSNSNN